MNHKNVFTAIGVILTLQGVVFYLMGDKMSADVFPTLDGMGRSATVGLLQLASVFLIALGLVAYAARNAPQMAWAYATGFGLISLNSLKHLLVDHVNVPVPAIAIQLGITFVCAYLWIKSNKPEA